MPLWLLPLGGTSKDATAKACAQDAATVLSALDNFQVASTGGNGSFPDASGTAVGSSTTTTMTGGVTTFQIKASPVATL